MGAFSFHMSTGSDDTVTKETKTTPNPNPFKWEFIAREVYDNALAIKVKYPDCTNFEGIKVMVFRGGFVLPKRLDPHFFEDDNNRLLARFRPDEEGWGNAKAFAQSI